MLSLPFNPPSQHEIEACLPRLICGDVTWTRNAATGLSMLQELAGQTDRKIDLLTKNPPRTAGACFNAIRDLAAHLATIDERLTDLRPSPYNDVKDHVERAHVLLRAADHLLGIVPRRLGASQQLKEKLESYLAETISLAEWGTIAGYEDLISSGLECAFDYRIPPREMVIPANFIQFNHYLSGLDELIDEVPAPDDAALRPALEALSAAYALAKKRSDPDALTRLQEDFNALCISLGDVQRRRLGQTVPLTPPPQVVDRQARDENIANCLDLNQRILIAFERHQRGNT